MMKIRPKISLLLFLLILSNTIIGQQNKPKVALVLSGGGAKGIAHIPTLQALDSLGIVPDIIFGTSMGSIVGALYASGYSGDSIASISNSTNWAKLFSNDIPITAVGNEEKSEYERYLFEYGLDKGDSNKKTSIISDQNINGFFNELVYPVNDIKDFDKLPIPFRAIATDIVNGKEVILDKGSLSFAMRSSMSIPAVFTPMEYKDVLLIDGGVLNNFPTDIAKEWGADIIIGSDVGGGMEPIEKLNSPVTIVFQSAMLASNLKVPPNKKLCDVLIDHTKYLTHSTGSFGKNIEIFEEGKIATNENISELAAIAKKLKNFKQAKPKLPEVSNDVILDTIIYEGISKDNMALFLSRVNIDLNTSYTLQEIREASNNALGTNLFDAISFHLFHKDDKTGLEVTATEKSKHLFKATLHYDDYRGVGFFLNYTARNLLGSSSRTIVSLDISNDFRYRIQYQKNFGASKDWWFRSDFYGEQLNQRTYIRGDYSGDLRSEHLQFDNAINLNIDSFKNYVGIGFTSDWNRIRPKIEGSIFDRYKKLTYYDFKNIDVYAHYVHNTLNKIFYSDNGTYIKIKLSTSIGNSVNSDSSKQLSIDEVDGSVNHFTKLRYRYEKRFKINEKLSGIVGVTGGYTYFQNKNETNDFSKLGYAANYFLGGNIKRPRIDTFVIPGIEENELAVSQFSMLHIAMQYQILSDIYFTPHANIGSVGFGNLSDYFENSYKPKGKWVDQTATSLLATAGITTSYNSIIGPVNFDISWSNNLGGARLFFGLGYHFNP